jgi:HTH-type transcriptional regulator/antitoxin HigA
METIARTDRAPAEVFPPGEYIQDELEERGWTQEEFANILGRPKQSINQIIRGKKEITPETALGIAEAFGTSAEVWLNLEQAYRLWKAGSPNPSIARRARLRELLPIRELQRRGWLSETDDLDRLEREVCEYLEIDSLDQDPHFPFAARKSGDRIPCTPAQIAWAFRCKHLAESVEAPRFNKKKLSETVGRLKDLCPDPSNIERVPDLLREMGIRLIVVPHLTGTKIDGATFWLNASSPVVALSLRFKRIDYFWFTLFHELAHVRQGHEAQGFLDSELLQPDSRPRSRREKEADEMASEWLVPRKELTSFVKRTSPYYSTETIRRFASSLGVHPGIVVGRLQFLKEVPYSHHQRLLRIKLEEHLPIDS